MLCGRKRHDEPLTIKVISDSRKEKEVIMNRGTLLEAFRGQLEGIQAPCGGRRLCGKCRIQVLEGGLPITAEDESFFTGKGNSSLQGASELLRRPERMKEAERAGSLPPAL